MSSFLKVGEKLKPGDEIRIIAPARSLAIISLAQRSLARQRLEELGLKVTFGKHVEECDMFNSSSIKARLEDLHAAFSDPTIKGILTVIGGFNSNQLLRYLDYNMIRSHPKVLCGYSDITALQNAIFSKTGLVTYSGPHFSTFGMEKGFEFTLDYFRKCLFSEASFNLTPSSVWSDDTWYLDQENRNYISNDGYTVIQPGEAHGTILGGNLGTFNLLHGTEFMPSLKDSVLFLEDTEAFSDVVFDRHLQSIIHQPEFQGVRGIVIGRFQRKSEMTPVKIKTIIQSKKELKHLPVIYGADFGHTDPHITFPIGGEISVRAGEDNSVTLKILKH